MKTLLMVTLLGVAMTTVGVAEAAPGGTCGEGGGSWERVDALCATDGSNGDPFVCVVWIHDPTFPYQVC